MSEYTLVPLTPVTAGYYRELNGRGIVKIERTAGDGSAGTVDTYTITYTNSTTSTFQIRNGPTENGMIDAYAARLLEVEAQIRSIAASFNIRTWATGQSYGPGTIGSLTAKRDAVLVSGVWYVAAVEHVAGASFATDLAAGKWLTTDPVQLRGDLADTGTGKGMEMIPSGVLPVPDYTTLKAKAALGFTRFYVTGPLGTAKPSGIAGSWQVDPTDTTSAEDGGTILVQGSIRIKRDYTGSVCVSWFGTVGDGATDDTAAIQAAIDSMAGTYQPTVLTALNKGSTLFFPPGVYRVTELTCYTNNVAMYGYGAQLYGTDKDAVILRVRGNDIRIEGFEMTHDVTTQADWSTKTGHAIYLEPNVSQVGCKRITISNIYAHHIAHICIAGDRCEDVKVTGCTVEYCGGAGILMNATEGECLISGNRVYNVGDDGIMLVPVASSNFASANGGRYNGGQVIGNTVDKGGNIYGIRGGTYGGYPNGASGIKVGGERVIVDSNVVTNSGAGAIFITYENGYPANGVTISNNRLYNTLYYANGSGYQLIRIPDTAPGTIANDIQIIDNVIDTSTYGVFAPRATNMIVRGNTLRNLAIGVLTNGAYITIDSNYGRDFDIGLPFADPATFPTANRAPISNDNGASFLTITNNYFDSGYGTNTGTVVRWLSSDTVVFNNVFRNFQYDAVNLQPYPFAGWQRNFSNSTTTNVGEANGANVLALYDGVSTPATVPTTAQLYVDTADGDLKVRFGDGVIKTIVTDV